MQKMICEMCSSNEIIKQDGVYVCQNCGTKYTVEEARKLIGTVKIDKSDENEKYIVLAERAINNSDIENAIKYCELVQENDPDNWMALFYLPYFRIENNPENPDLIVPFAHAIRSSFELIKQNEPAELQSDIIELLINRIQSVGCTVHIKVIQIMGEYYRAYLNDEPTTNTETPHASVFLNGAATCIREYFPEFESQAEELEEQAKEYNEYIMNTIKQAGEAYVRTQENRLKKSSGCYIATCVYGSYDCPEVWTLRRYRDYKLASKWYGRLFIRFYYATSPTIVKYFGHARLFNCLIKPRLDRIVANLNASGFADTPYQDENY